MSFFYPLVYNGYRKGPAAQCFLPKIDTVLLSTTHYQFLARHTEAPAGLPFLPRWFFLVCWGKTWRKEWGCVFVWKGRSWKMVSKQASAKTLPAKMTVKQVLPLFCFCSFCSLKPHFLLLPPNPLSFPCPVSLYHFLFLLSLCLSPSVIFFPPR